MPRFVGSSEFKNTTETQRITEKATLREEQCHERDQKVRHSVATIPLPSFHALQTVRNYGPLNTRQPNTPPAVLRSWPWKRTVIFSLPWSRSAASG